MRLSASRVAAYIYEQVPTPCDRACSALVIVDVSSLTLTHLTRTLKRKCTRLHAHAHAHAHSYADVIPFRVVFYAQALSASAMICVAVLLTIEWITILDGGRSHTTPPWAVKLKNFCIGFGFFTEVGIGTIEQNVGEAGDRIDATDGTINFFKCLCTIMIMQTLGFLCLIYVAKINKQLKAGSGKENKTIKLYLKCVLFLCTFASLYKATGFVNFGYVIHFPPPCSFGLIDPMQTLFLCFLYVVAYCMRPKKKNTTAKVASGSTKTSGPDSTISTTSES